LTPRPVSGAGNEFTAFDRQTQFTDALEQPDRVRSVVRADLC